MIPCFFSCNFQQSDFILFLSKPDLSGKILIFFVLVGLYSYLIWSDSFVSADRITELKPFQRINHFPGMVEVTRKDCLARNMMK